MTSTYFIVSVLLASEQEGHVLKSLFPGFHPPALFYIILLEILSYFPQEPTHC